MNSLKHLRIVDVELFITAARLKNLGKAALLHHLSQSAASTAIRRVESAFNAPLCTHEKKRFSLTREGILLLPRLERWVEELQTLILTQEQTALRFVTTHALAQIAMPALLTLDRIDFRQLRPDQSYAAILQSNADLALVLDNAPWKNVLATEIGKGLFQIYSKIPNASPKPILLPEDQIEVLSLQQSWQQTHNRRLPIRSRIPSWSLIAQICSESTEIGFLPEFLAKKFHLHPVSWQPPPSSYRLLAIHKDLKSSPRLTKVIEALRGAFERV